MENKFYSPQELSLEYNPLGLFGRYGFALCKLPSNVINDIDNEIETIKNSFNKTPHNGKNLAGQINKEYQVSPIPSLNNVVKSTIDFLDKETVILKESTSIFDNTHAKNIVYQMGKMWVNFQEKYEYNPIHDHTGIWSYVVWHKIPYYHENEQRYGPGIDKNPESNSNGQFKFVYADFNKLVQKSLNIDKKMEGHIAVFPSNLHHIVYPFYTSDEYRITLSGNVYLDHIEKY